MKENGKDGNQPQTKKTCLKCKYCIDSERNYHPSTKDLFRCGCRKHGSTIHWLTESDDNEHSYCAYYRKRKVVEQLSMFG